LAGLLAGGCWAVYEIGEIVGLVPITSDPALELFAHGIVTLVIVGLYARQAS